MNENENNNPIPMGHCNGSAKEKVDSIIDLTQETRKK